jgi:hypothetical protein
MTHAQTRANSIVDACVRDLLRESPHGFSETKIRAAGLIALTALTATQIGQELGISGYTVRDWLMEGKFNALITRIRRDVGTSFVEVVARDQKTEHVGQLVEYRLIPIIESLVADEIMIRVKKESPKWVKAAHVRVIAYLRARSKKRIDQRVLKRAMRDAEGDTQLGARMIWGELANEKDPLWKAAKLLRHRMHDEIAKVLPGGEKAKIARELLAELSGDDANDTY